MVKALKAAFTPAIRTLAQTLAGGLGALGVASVSDFKNVAGLATVLLWGAVLAALVAFFQNFAEALPE